MSVVVRLLTETVRSLPQAARELPPLRASRPVHPSCLWRWARHGVDTPAGRIYLEVGHLAGRVITSQEAVQRFLVAVAEAKRGTGRVALPAVQRTTTRSAHVEAKTKLDRKRI